MDECSRVFNVTWRQSGGSSRTYIWAGKQENSKSKCNSGKTYSLLSFNEIAKYAEIKLKNNQYRNGYRDGVVLIDVDIDKINQFICPYVKIDKNIELNAEVAKRRPDEDHYIRIKAKNGKNLKTNKVELILYRNDVLKETNENSTSLHIHTER